MLLGFTMDALWLHHFKPKFKVNCICGSIMVRSFLDAKGILLRDALKWVSQSIAGEYYTHLAQLDDKILVITPGWLKKKNVIIRTKHRATKVVWQSKIKGFEVRISRTSILLARFIPTSKDILGWKMFLIKWRGDSNGGWWMGILLTF